MMNSLNVTASLAPSIHHDGKMCYPRHDSGQERVLASTLRDLGQSRVGASGISSSHDGEGKVTGAAFRRR